VRREEIFINQLVESPRGWVVGSLAESFGVSLAACYPVDQLVVSSSLVVFRVVEVIPLCFLVGKLACGPSVPLELQVEKRTNSVTSTTKIMQRSYRRYRLSSISRW
jgi:hypothetical protein